MQKVILLSGKNKCNMRQISIVILLVTLICSCKNGLFDGKPDIVIELINNSDDTLKNVHLSTTEKVNSAIIEVIYPTQKKTISFSMANNRTDGSYTLSYTKDSNKMDSLKTGYYTNGFPMNKKISYQIENDTTIVSFD